MLIKGKWGGGDVIGHVTVTSKPCALYSSICFEKQHAVFQHELFYLLFIFGPNIFVLLTWKNKHTSTRGTERQTPLESTRLPRIHTAI
jgi:hypothetical protein